MNKRMELHELLCEALGSRHVYFQPPESIKMKYPAIVYFRNNINSRYADNNTYMQSSSYTITVIDKNPDSEIIERVLLLPMCRHDRHFVSDNLNHDTFTIYY